MRTIKTMNRIKNTMIAIVKLMNAIARKMKIQRLS